MIDKIRNGVRALCTADSGATAVEYAIMVGFVAIVIVAAVTAVGITVRGLFEGVLPGL